MKNLMLKFGQACTAAILLLSSASIALADDDFTQAELDQMLAPVALYPDTVLTHVLIAATYPLEVVQASRWVKANPGLQGDAAVRAVESKEWDPSVKALVAFPQLLTRLSEDLDWTEQLGEAFLTDETNVLASVQNLRQKAYANGALNDNKHIVVEREKEIIVIEPARKEVVYVPVYDTRVVYGDWWWPSHPPVYWAGSGAYFHSSPFYWGVSVNVRPWFYFGIFDWHHRHVVVNHHYYHKPPRYYPKRHKHYVNAGRWQHDTVHRRGVHYRHTRLNREYNEGYGYRQPTREVQGKPVRYARSEFGADTREHKQPYQRRNAEQVNVRQPREYQDARKLNEQERRERADKLQQRLEHKVRYDNGREQHADKTLQRRYEPQRLHAGSHTENAADKPQRVISTEQLRQREQLRQPQPQQASREFNRERTPQTGPAQRNIPAQREIKTQREVPVQREHKIQREHREHREHKVQPDTRAVREIRPQREPRMAQQHNLGARSTERQGNRAIE